MFDGNIIAQYVDNIKNTDTLTACRAVVKQCFDKYGGNNYENFYYPYSGLFPANSGSAPDWFALYEVKYDENGQRVEVLKSEDRWYGVTYKEDKENVMQAIQGLKDSGLYPQKLWEE